MTNEERDLITRYVARVGGAASTGFGGSVPATQPALPPIDRDADQFIAQQFQTHPEARYRITQMAVVQEAALAEAQNRIQRLEWELQQAQRAAQENAQRAQQAPQQSRGFLGGLFGGGGQSQPQPQGQVWNQAGPGQPAYAPPGFQAGAPPSPQYPPNYQPGMFQQRGSGFLGSALTTAAGVAGGMVAGNALMGLFEGHGGGLGGGGFGGGGFGGGQAMGPENETIINNYGDAGAPGGAPEFDQNVSYDSPQDGGGGWDSGGGGFDDNQA